MSKRKRIMSLVAAGLICVGSVQATHKIDASSKTGKAKNVILLIADGMSQEAVTLARYKDEDQKLAMDGIASGGVRTYWENGPITDSAPGGTAFATGQKTDKKNVGTSSEGQALATVLEASELMNKSTGLIATSEITHATPADFSAHINNRSDYTSIITQQANLGLDVVLGGGLGSDTNYSKEHDSNGKPTDEGLEGAKDFKDDMKSEIEASGYEVVTTKDEMNNSDSDKIWGMFADGGMNIDANRPDSEPTLAEMTKTAINKLDKDEDGFFLMVEGSQIDWEAHSNNSVGMITEILAFDEAVQTALDFAKEDGETVVIVTTDHGNSGITIGNSGNSNNYSSLTFEDSVNRYQDVKISESAFNNKVLPTVTNDDNALKSAVKEHFGIDNLTDAEIASIKGKKINKVISDRFGIGFTTGGHTSEDVYLGWYGPTGTSKLKGIIQNTDIADYIYSVLGGQETLGKISLEELTKDIYQKGSVVFGEDSGCTYEIDNTTDKHRPTVTITKDDTVIVLNLNTNDYIVNNGEAQSLKTVMPYINGEFFVSQELINVINEIGGAN